MGDRTLRLILILRSVVFMVLMAVATVIWSFACLLSA
ncbi:MAG: 1-acyl-sn-glycerol-3-phosphate acyltransferase, partial [Herbaspirillum sp.]|nr:1-acyl-sn-glycerol-3-phosphate acyltransferase [Herbaspirillum sp.]